MTSYKHLFSRLALMALAAILSADVFAQAPKPAATVAATEDMRLWSFGDCDRRFPYVNSDEHKECVRVVGSPEARDARALRVCEASNGTDRDEAERCKTAYLANKEKAAQETLAASSPSAALPPPSPEVMRRVKAITTAALEEQRAAAQGEARPRSEEPEPLSDEAYAAATSGSSIGTIVLVVVVVAGIGAFVVRRKQARSA